jgi:transcriptional regulator with XRE-family HTH domain
MKSGFGSILRDWRAMRRVSQLDLALKTNISQRHISFVESGRSRPSREMVAKLAEGLDLPLRVRNEILLAAGYAPLYLERRLDLAEMKKCASCARANIAASRTLSSCRHRWGVEHPPAERRGYPDRRPLRRRVGDASAFFQRDGQLHETDVFGRWDATPHSQLAGNPPILMARLIREAAANPGSPSERLRRELGEAAALPMADAAMRDEPLESTLPLELLVGNVRLRLFSTFTTFGTPQDVTLQELRIDMSFPADDETDRFLATAADVGIAGALRRE